MLNHRLLLLQDLFGEQESSKRNHRQDLFFSNIESSAKHHLAYFTDESDELHLPVAVAPEDGDLEDFFATIATYYPDFSPVTPLIHVLSPDERELIISRRRSSLPLHFKERQSRAISACLGTILGEGVQSGVGHVESGSNPQYAVCKRTLAFTLARATLVHGDSIPSELIVSRWCRLRELTGMTTNRSIIQAVEAVHACTFKTAGTHPTDMLDWSFFDALDNIFDGRDNDGLGLLRFFVSTYPHIEPFVALLNGPFDERLSGFTRIVAAINSDSRSQQMDQAAVAFMCNKILPGSFSHIAVLEKLIDIYPAAIVWYGFFAQLLKPSVSQYPNQSKGLLMKLRRDLKAPFSFDERPQCDISLQELEVLSQIALRSETLNPSQQRSLLVSIAPGVEIVSRFAGETDHSREAARRAFDSEVKRRQAIELLDEALSVLRGTSERDLGRISSKKARKDR